MIILNALRAVAIVAGVTGLAACQTTATTPVSAEQAVSLYSGIWDGHFINRQGTKYPVTLSLNGQNNQIRGKAKIPDSTYDEAPSVSGTYSGNATKLESSSGFKYDLAMSVAEDGGYWLMGPVTGPNTGRLELRRK